MPGPKPTSTLMADGPRQSVVIFQISCKLYLNLSQTLSAAYFVDSFMFSYSSYV